MFWRYHDDTLRGCRCPTSMSPCTYLLSRLLVLGQLHLAHAARTDCLSQRPSPRAGGCDGGPALGGGRQLAGPGVGSGAIGRHCRGRRRVRRIPRVASSAGVGAGGILAAAGGLLLGDVGLLVVAAGDAAQGGLGGTGLRVSSGAGGGALGAMGPVDGPPRRGRGAHGGGRGWGSGRHGERLLDAAQGAEAGRRVRAEGESSGQAMHEDAGRVCSARVRGAGCEGRDAWHARRTVSTGRRSGGTPAGRDSGAAVQRRARQRHGRHEVDAESGLRGAGWHRRPQQR